MKLTLNHIALYCEVLNRGIGRSCNDLNPGEVCLLTKDQWKEFSKNYHDWNGDPETFKQRTNWVLEDYAVIGYINHLLVSSYIESNGL